MCENGSLNEFTSCLDYLLIKIRDFYGNSLLDLVPKNRPRLGKVINELTLL